MVKARPGTLDDWIRTQIYVANEYKLRPRIVKDKRILDIGAHVGYFSTRCLEFGADFVLAYEIDRQNFEVLTENLSSWNIQAKAEARRVAVWRSDRVPTLLTFESAPMWGTALNTGGIGVVFPNEGHNKVSTIGLDQILSNNNIDIIKIDAESSEWPILLTSKLVFDVPVILGEYHEIGGDYDDHDPAVLDLGYDCYNINLLESLFKDHGYKFSYDRYTNLNLGHFWAWKD